MRLEMTTGLLVLALGMPSTLMAQPPVGKPGNAASIWIVPTKPSSIERKPLLERQGVRAASARAAQAKLDAQPPSDRSWAGRHPAATGAMIGVAAGALWGASMCWRQVCGDGHGPLLVAFGAGLGAGIGSGVGLTISIARR